MRRSSIDLLEPRSLLAASVFTINGTGGDDVITFLKGADDAHIVLYVNQTPQTLTLADISGFSVQLGAGDDMFNYATIPSSAPDDAEAVNLTDIPVTVNGGDGNDSVAGSNGSNVHSEIFGDAGDDRLFSGGPSDIHGGDGNDSIRGSNQKDYLIGDAGNDTVLGLDGNDNLVGGAGKNTLDGGFGNDRLVGSNGPDVIRGSNGEDRLYGFGGDDKLSGERDRDRVYGGDGNDSIDGGISTDRLYGEAGDDTINGNNGDDYLFGGPGADLLHGGDGDDLFPDKTDDDVIRSL